MWRPEIRHTLDALETAVEALKPIINRRLPLVLGAMMAAGSVGFSLIVNMLLLR